MLALLAVLAAPAADRVATLHLGSGVPDLLGGGVSLTAFRPFELEVGAATGILYDTAYARAGVALRSQVLAGGGLWLTGEADGGVAPFLDGRLSVGVAF